jgi:hypothetical protein
MSGEASERLLPGEIPEHQAIVETGGDGALPVGGDGNSLHGTAMTEEGSMRENGG